MKTIQINQCTQEELEWLPGVGQATAKKIIEARPIEAQTQLEQIVPPSAWLKIEQAGVEFAFGTGGEEPGEAPPPEPVVEKVPSEPPIVLQEPEPMTLRRILPGQELTKGASYICIWNMRWAPDGQAVTPADAPIQKEITEQLATYGISIAFVHYGASVRVHTPSRGRVPLVLFEIIRDTEEAESGEEDTRNHQRDGQGD